MLAALLCTAALPAFAGWDRVASVEFSMRNHHQSIQVKIKAHSIALTSRDGDVFCRDVGARLADNRTRMILHNVSLTFKKTVKVDIPGGVRDVNRLDFDCWSLYSWRTRVDVAANTTPPQHNLRQSRIASTVGINP